MTLCSVVFKFAENASLNAHKNIVVVSVDSDVTLMLQYHGDNIGKIGMNVVRQTALSKVLLWVMSTATSLCCIAS